MFGNVETLKPETQSPVSLAASVANDAVTQNAAAYARNMPDFSDIATLRMLKRYQEQKLSGSQNYLPTPSDALAMLWDVITPAQKAQYTPSLQKDGFDYEYTEEITDIFADLLAELENIFDDSNNMPVMYGGSRLAYLFWQFQILGRELVGQAKLGLQWNAAIDLHALSEAVDAFALCCDIDDSVFSYFTSFEVEMAA